LVVEEEHYKLFAPLNMFLTPLSSQPI